jgi:hypothetical protein
MYERNRHCWDNRLFSRYELTLIERGFYYHQGVGNKYNTGQRDLFDDLILNIRVSDLCKRSEPGG